MNDTSYIPTGQSRNGQQERLVNVLSAWVEQNESVSRRRSGRRNPVSTPCLAVNCTGKTTGGKKYCSEHIDHIPYAANIRASLAAMETEVKTLQKHSTRKRPTKNCPIKPDSLVLEDILLCLRYNIQFASIDYLSRMLWLPLEAMHRYIEYLSRNGQVCIRNINHGRVLVALSENKCLLIKEVRLREKEDKKARRLQSLREKEKEAKKVTRQLARLAARKVKAPAETAETKRSA